MITRTQVYKNGKMIKSFGHTVDDVHAMFEFLKDKKELKKETEVNGNYKIIKITIE